MSTPVKPWNTLRKALLTERDLAITWINATQSPCLGYDIEHNNGTGRDLLIAGLSLYCPERHEAVYIPFNHINLPGPRVDKIDPLPVFEALAKHPVVTFSGSDDTGYPLARHNVLLTVHGDTYILQRMMQQQQHLGLKDQLMAHGLIHAPIRFDDLFPLGSTDRDITQLDFGTLDALDRLIDYTTQDAYGSYWLHELERPKVSANYRSFSDVYKLEMVVMPILGAAAIDGLNIDKPAFDRAAQLIQEEADLLESNILQTLNRTLDTAPDFSLTSPARVSCALFNAQDRVPNPVHLKRKRKADPLVHDDRDLPGLGLKPMTRPSKTEPFHQYSTSTLELERIVDQHPVIADLLRWKSLNAVCSKDLKNVSQWTTPYGTIHPHFQQVGSDGTSRIYTGGQGGAAVISLSKEVRKAFRPGANRAFVVVDYKAAEPRLMALMAGEDKILDLVNQGHDYYKVAYGNSHNMHPQYVTKEQRDTQKVVSLATNYGSTSVSVARALKCSEQDAAKIVQDFWQAHPKLAEWAAFRRQIALQKGYTVSLMGRIRRLHNAFSDNPEDKKSAERQAVNSSCQNSCGDLLKQAIVKIVNESRTLGTWANKVNLKFVMPVFDAVLLEIDEQYAAQEQLDETVRQLKALTEFNLTNGQSWVKMTVDIGISNESWAAAMDSKL